MNNNNEKNLLKWIQIDIDDIIDKNFKPVAINMHKMKANHA